MKVRYMMPVLTVAIVACGGGEPADTAPQGGATGATGGGSATSAAVTPPTGAITTPAWYTVDHDAHEVSISVVAGETAANNHWNMNGTTNGDIAILVPEGYTVSATLVNQDPNMAHSLGVSEVLTNFAMPPQPTPAFPGAITANPTSMMDATMSGETESFEFVASQEGTYMLLCYVPGHTAVGMWSFLIVTDDGSAGVRTR